MTERRTRLAERTLVDFFHANPGEELTVEDAAAKLGSSTRTAMNSLSTLAGAGILQRISIYRLAEPEEVREGVKVA